MSAVVLRGFGCRHRNGGFTLLEMLLALTLLAFALGLLIGMLGDGLRQVGDAERETEATLHAQSLLDALGTLEPLVAGQRDGTFADGRYRWTLAITPAEDPAPVAASAPAPAPLLGAPVLFQVVLDVTWGDGGPRRRVHLVTLRARQPEVNAVAGQ